MLVTVFAVEYGIKIRGHHRILLSVGFRPATNTPSSIFQCNSHALFRRGLLAYHHADGRARAFVSQCAHGSVLEEIEHGGLQLDIAGVRFVFLQVGDSREGERFAGKRFAVDASAVYGEMSVCALGTIEKIAVIGGALDDLGVCRGGDWAFGKGVGAGGESIWV